MNKIFFDDFNAIHIGTKRAEVYEKNDFFEALIINEILYVSSTYFSKLINIFGENYKLLFKLIDEKKINIVHDFIPIRLIKRRDIKNAIVELKFGNEYCDESFKDKMEIFGRKERKIFEKRIKYLDIKSIDMNNLYQFICNILNDKDLLISIYKDTKPYHILPEIIEKMEYRVEVLENVFLIHAEEETSDHLKSILAGEFMIPIIRAYLNIRSQVSFSCDCLYSSKPARVIFDKIAYQANNNITQQINTLLNFEGVPDFKQYSADKNLDISDVLKIRNRAVNLRRFLYENKNSEEIDLLKEYYQKLQKEFKFLDTIHYKTIRFLVGSSNPILGGLGLVTDLLEIDKKIKNKFDPTIKLSDIFK